MKTSFEHKMIYAKVTDPSGHVRVIKLTQLPAVLGTDFLSKQALRDSKISAEALVVQDISGQLILRVQQKGLTVSVGDLKLHALEIPFGVGLKIADSELRFFEDYPDHRNDIEKAPAGTWLTVSEAGQQLLQNLKKASQTRLSIYLCGETGTGKEVLAKMIHDQSARASGSFVAINCGALAVSLVESELFGHVKGAYTGAIRDRPGAFLQAHGGTLFLDEVGDLPNEVQVKLLRFLESGEMRQVGSDRVLHADVRIICATHKPLTKLVKDNLFRQDLYYRLASIPIEISPLRSRPDDVEYLSKQFAHEHSKTITKEAMHMLMSYAWPGNVRQLRHTIERAAGISGPFETTLNAVDFAFLTEIAVQQEADFMLPGISKLKDMEKILILRALRVAKGNRSEASKILGVARSTLFEKMKRHRIAGPKTINYFPLPVV